VITISKDGRIVIRANNIKHAILIFDKKFNHDLQWALEHEGYTLTMENAQ